VKKIGVGAKDELVDQARALKDLKQCPAIWESVSRWWSCQKKATVEGVEQFPHDLASTAEQLKSTAVRVGHGDPEAIGQLSVLVVEAIVLKKAGAEAAGGRAGSTLEKPGALRQAAVQVHDLVAADKIRHQLSTVALAEVDVPGQGVQIFASASSGRLSAAQIKLLKSLGVPDENIIRGRAARLHAERNILNALPRGAKVRRWGIAWGAKNKPVPCKRCAPHVRGRIEATP
jgi:hypothetical protein